MLMAQPSTLKHVITQVLHLGAAELWKQTLLRSRFAPLSLGFVVQKCVTIEHTAQSFGHGGRMCAKFFFRDEQF